MNIACAVGFLIVFSSVFHGQCTQSLFSPSHSGVYNFGLDWIGLDWIGLDWIGLDWDSWYDQDFWYVFHVERSVEILPKRGNLEIGNSCYLLDPCN